MTTRVDWQVPVDVLYEYPKLDHPLPGWGGIRRMTVIKLAIEGMTCGHCAMHVKQALLKVPGVDAAEVDLQAKEATVQGRADIQALLDAIEAEGYSAKLA